MVEGVHFLRDQDPADVAWKLVSVNLSDLAAKGAHPLGVLLGYALGSHDTRFVEGLRETLAHYDAPLLGGETVAGEGTRTLGLTAIGRASHLPVPSRTGARVGDILYVTGSVGGAMMGLERLRAGHGDSVAYRRPVALLTEGRALAPHVTAMMDVSDGLLLDAARMAKASGVSIEITSLAVPINAPEARRGDALRWGDDYQLLLTAPVDVTLPIQVTAIGNVVSSTGAPIVLDGEPLQDMADLGYQH